MPIHRAYRGAVDQIAGERPAAQNARASDDATAVRAWIGVLPSPPPLRITDNGVLLAFSMMMKRCSPGSITHSMTTCQQRGRPKCGLRLSLTLSGIGCGKHRACSSTNVALAKV